VPSNAPTPIPALLVRLYGQVGAREPPADPAGGSDRR
jgi:hypothetical protein